MTFSKKLFLSITALLTVFQGICLFASYSIFSKFYVETFNDFYFSVNAEVGNHAVHLLEKGANRNALESLMHKSLDTFDSVSAMKLMKTSGVDMGHVYKNTARSLDVNLSGLKYPYFKEKEDTLLYFSLVPTIPHRGESYVLVSEVSKERLNTLARRLLLNKLMLNVFALILVSILLGFLISKYLAQKLTQPLSRVNEKICSMTRSGVFGETLEVRGSDEVAQLAGNFNALMARLKETQQKLIQSEKNAAIVSTVQTVTHDIRKPFEFLKITLRTLRSMKHPEEIMSMTPTLLNEVSKASTRVDAMLEEIKEVTYQTKLSQEAVPFENLLYESLLEAVFTTTPYRDARITYDLQHTQSLWVDPEKCVRVFSNLIGNALKQMRPESTLWFKTRDIGERLEIKVGNSGSFISVADLPRIFEPFYTRNNTHGTGLGLCIVEKLVLAHGGSVSCQSSQENETVEFTLLLPSVRSENQTPKVQLPQFTSDLPHLGLI